MNEHHISVKKTARYYSLGGFTNNTKNIIIVLHGFGMNGKDFINSFQPLLNELNYIIAPEALNRYYLKSASGAVGATWMTREDRLYEINDYINYLDDLYMRLGLESVSAKITVIGFSQGASTATRWVNAGKNRVDTMIVYAGEVAPELLPLSLNSGLRKTKNIFICGDRDEIFTPPLVAEMKLKYQELNFTEIEFKGKHVVNTEVLIPLFL